MAFNAAIGEPMKAISHHQQLKTPPRRLHGIEAIGIVDLAAKLADDPLNDVGGPRHPRMSEVSKEKRHLVLECEDLSLQPTVSQGLSSSLPDPKPEGKLLFGVDVKEPGSQPQEALDASTRAFVEVAEVMLEILLPMADADLEGEPRKDFSAGTEERWISIHNEALKGITDVVSKREQEGLPVLGGFVWGEASQGDIVRGGIGTEEKRVAIAFNVDGLSIKQEVTAPARVELLSDLDKAFAVLSQSIDPLKDSVGSDMEFSAHSTVRSFPVEVEMSGAQDEAWSHGSCPGSLTRSRKGPSALVAPPAPNLACPQPLASVDLNGVRRLSSRM